MKPDLTKLPLGEALIGFILVATAAAFVVAFTAVDNPADEALVDEIETEAPSGSVTPAPTGDGGLEVVMLDNSFDPNELSVTAGESVTIALTNEGAAIHNMRIAGADNEYDTDDDAVSDPETVRGGQDATLAWDAPAEAGEIDFRCDFHPAEMTGTITVQ